MEGVPKTRYLVFFAIAIVGCLIDLLTKSWAFEQLGMPGAAPHRVLWLWEPIFGLETSTNEGALFGVGQGMVLVFAILSILAALGIVGWLFVAKGAQDRFLNVTLGFIMAGILGNLYDRLALHGLIWPGTTSLHEAGTKAYAVRDWILVMIGDYRWPNFNIADSLLVVGAFLLVWHSFRCDERQTSGGGGSGRLEEGNTKAE